MFFYHLKSGSLKQKLVQRIVFISLIVIFSLLCLDSIFVINNEKEKLQHEFSHIEGAMLENLSNSLWTLNKPRAQTQIEDLISEDYVTHIEIYDGDKLFVSTQNNKPNDNNSVKKTYDLTFLVDNEKVNIGRVDVIADTTGIYSNAIKEGIIFLLINSLLVLLLIYFTLSFLNKNLFTHLETMSDFMESASLGDNPDKFALARIKHSDNETDELDHLVNAFNFQREELVKKNKELSLSQEKFYKIFQSSPDAILITAYEDGRILDVNKSFYRVFGYTESDEIFGKTTIELNLWASSENRDEWIAHLQEKGAIYMREGKYKKKSGEESDCVASSQIMHFDHVQGLVWTVRDISDRKRYEAEILKSQRRLHNLAKSQEEIRENERTGISREIHDELGQSFTGLKIDLSWLKDNLSNEQKATLKINNMIENVDHSVDVVRKISSDLRPAILDDLGLVAAIEWFTKDFSERTGIQHELEIESDDLQLNKERDTAVFRIYQEALTNISRHSEASEFKVNMTVHEQNLELIIIDNGIGITQDQIDSEKSIGIIGMQERAVNIGAQIRVNNREGNSGVEVSLICPLNIELTG